MIQAGTLTFHGAYNYGSVLQTYALQQFVTKLGEEKGVDIDYSVINYRPQSQKELYWQVKRPKTKSNMVKWLMRLPYGKKLKKQAQAFEDFLQRYVHLTDEVDEKSIEKYAESFDYYISGSDQIFNVRASDFSYTYLLDFTDSCNKISYAASLGPLQIDWSKYDQEKYAAALRKFKNVSLREKKSKAMVDELLGTTDSEIHVDPTLLLSADEWRKVQSGRNYKNGKYILIYCLEPTKKHLRIAKKLSKALKLPIVCTGYRCKHDYFNSFVKMYDAGPADFLALIDNAAFVLTSSFHGTAFSVIYDKLFWCIDGMSDNRISNLLTMTGLTGNAITEENLPDFRTVNPLRASQANASEALEKEKQKSREYLIKALGL